jgi:hypothetical protein
MVAQIGDRLIFLTLLQIKIPGFGQGCGDLMVLAVSLC